MHPILQKYGWEYKSCSIWDKGIGHIAGNCNTKTISTLPVVSEVCAHYVRRPEFNAGSEIISMKDWLIREWKRSGLPFHKANEACGVANAASRKYLTSDHLWYMPPSDAFEMIVKYANEYGNPLGRPYFSIDGVVPMTAAEWDLMRPVFHCPIGKTNIWSQPQLNGKERIMINGKVAHKNQKPMNLISDLITMTTDEGDIIWDPFGGLATTNVCGLKLKRSVYSSEIDERMFEIGKNRIKKSVDQFL